MILRFTSWKDGRSAGYWKQQAEKARHALYFVKGERDAAQNEVRSLKTELSETLDRLLRAQQQIDKGGSEVDRELKAPAENDHRNTDHSVERSTAPSERCKICSRYYWKGQPACSCERTDDDCHEADTLRKEQRDLLTNIFRMKLGKRRPRAGSTPPQGVRMRDNDTAVSERQRLIQLAERSALDLMAENQMPPDVQEFARRHKLETFINGLWVQAFKEGVRAGVALTKGPKE